MVIINFPSKGAREGLAYHSAAQQSGMQMTLLPRLAKPSHNLDVERRVCPRSIGPTYVEWGHTEA